MVLGFVFGNIWLLGRALYPVQDNCSSTLLYEYIIYIKHIDIERANIEYISKKIMKQ